MSDLFPKERYSNQTFSLQVENNPELKYCKTQFGFFFSKISYNCVYEADINLSHSDVCYINIRGMFAAV